MKIQSGVVKHPGNFGNPPSIRLTRPKEKEKRTTSSEHSLSIISAKYSIREGRGRSETSSTAARGEFGLWQEGLRHSAEKEKGYLNGS